MFLVHIGEGRQKIECFVFEENAAGGVDIESGSVVTVISIVVKISVEVAMRDSEKRLAVALRVGGNGGEQNECRPEGSEDIASSPQIVFIGEDIIGAEDYEIVIEFFGSSGNRMC